MTELILEVTEATSAVVLTEDPGEVGIELEAEPSIVALEVTTQDFVEISEVGPQGPPGPTGATYVHTQSTPAATWTINHNLNTVRPIVLLLDSAPSEPVWADTVYPTPNQAVIQLDVAATGKAYF